MEIIDTLFCLIKNSPARVYFASSIKFCTIEHGSVLSDKKIFPTAMDSFFLADNARKNQTDDTCVDLGVHLSVSVSRSFIKDFFALSFTQYQGFSILSLAKRKFFFGYTTLKFIKVAPGLFAASDGSISTSFRDAIESDTILSLIGSATLRKIETGIDVPQRRSLLLAVCLRSSFPRTVTRTCLRLN